MSLLAELERLKARQAELLGLTQACLGLVGQEDLEALEDALARRAKVFHEVMAGHQRLAPSWRDWPARLAHLPSPEAARAQDLVGALDESGHRVLELDRLVDQGLRAIKDRLGQELRRLGQGQRLLAAYRPLPAGGPWGPDQLSRMG